MMLKKNTSCETFFWQRLKREKGRSLPPLLASLVGSLTPPQQASAASAGVSSGISDSTSAGVCRLSNGNLSIFADNG